MRFNDKFGMSKEVKVSFRRMRGGVVLLALAILTGIMVPAAVLAQESHSNHNAPFLRAGVDARYFGMGGAAVAHANDAAAAYWNPAGLANTTGLFATGMITGGLDFNRKHNYLGVSYGWENFTLAGSWINAGTTDLTGVGLDGQSGDTFNFNENALMVSGAFRAGPLNLGVTPKMVIQDVGTTVRQSGSTSETGFGLDAGAQFAVTDHINLGVAVQDLFTSVGDNVDNKNNERVPANVRIGGSIAPAQGVLVAADLEKEEDISDWKPHLGGEYWHEFNETFSGAVRAGVDDSDFAFGLGVGINDFVFNYAYVNEPQAFLNENHRFSVNLNAGEQRGVYRSSGDDRDGDGIADANDHCPNEPEDYDGFEDADGCPDYDNDGDGIADGVDQCPNQAEDFDGHMDDDGCPDLDNDGDGIMDVNDNCPNEAETFNGFEDSDGCPDDAPIYFPIAHINFKYNTAEISGADPIPVLEEVVRIMNENPGIRVEVQGHTDSDGTDEYNLDLSKRRADAIKEYLTRRGIDGARLETRGFGESRPIDTNSTDIGKARNRRVEFVVIR